MREEREVDIERGSEAEIERESGWKERESENFT